MNSPCVTWWFLAHLSLTSVLWSFILFLLQIPLPSFCHAHAYMCAHAFSLWKRSNMYLILFHECVRDSMDFSNLGGKKSKHKKLNNLPRNENSMPYAVLSSVSLCWFMFYQRQITQSLHLMTFLCFFFPESKNHDCKHSEEPRKSRTKHEQIKIMKSVLHGKAN